MKKKLKLLRNITSTQFTVKDLEVLYYLYEQTGKTGGYESIQTYAKENMFGITGDELHWLLNSLSVNGLIDATVHSDGGMYRIKSNGIQLIRAIEAEENKGCREKLLDRTSKQSPLRPIISIVVALGALVVAIIALT